jgi:hypothetical protein
MQVGGKGIIVVAAIPGDPNSSDNELPTSVLP